MWGKGPPKDNLESWQDIRQFVAEFPDDDHWSKWKTMVREVISAFEARGLAPLFRIGQSMHHIIVSTLDHHNLASEPRVTLEFFPGDQMIRIAYSTANLHFRDALMEERVAVSRAVPIALKYLRRLWTETRPTVPIPAELVS